MLVAALLLGACGDDDGDDTAGEDPAAELSGPPVKIGAVVERIFEDVRAEVHVAAEAAVDEINASGGIDGRPVEIEICDSKQNDPDSATDCARTLAADPDIVAVVGQWSITGEGANQVFTDAGMASIGNSPLSAADFQCQVCFPTTGGGLASVAGQANLIADELGPNVAMAFADVPAGQQLVGLVTNVLKARSPEATLQGIPVPVAVPDIAAQVEVARGSDGVAMVIPRDTAFSFIRGAKGAGVDSPIVITTQTMSEADLVSLGADAEGIYVVGNFALDGPGIDAFDEAMDAIDPDAAKTDPAKSMWLAVRLFAHAARGADEISRAGLLAHMPTIADFDTGGMTPTLDFTTPFTGLGGALPRVFNTSVFYARISDGEQVPVGEGGPVDAFTAEG